MRRQIGACGTVACLLFLPLPAVAQQDAQAEDEAPPQFTDEIGLEGSACLPDGKLAKSQGFVENSRVRR